MKSRLEGLHIFSGLDVHQKFLLLGKSMTGRVRVLRRECVSGSGMEKVTVDRPC